MNDAEYIAAIAEFYKDVPSPEFRAHYERLMHISAAIAAIAAAPAQPRDDAVFVVWWSDHMPNSTEADAWSEWCSLRSNQSAAQAQVGEYPERFAWARKRIHQWRNT